MLGEDKVWGGFGGCLRLLCLHLNTTHFCGNALPIFHPRIG